MRDSAESEEEYEMIHNELTRRAADAYLSRMNTATLEFVCSEMDRIERGMCGDESPKSFDRLVLVGLDKLAQKLAKEEIMANEDLF
jgi:hypothetical protein